MNELDFLRARHEAELPAFTNVLDALPADKWDYTPHERSPSARGIAWTMAVETKACCAMVDDGRAEWAPPPAPDSVDTVKAAFAEAYADLATRLAKLDDDGWRKPVRFVVGGEVKREAPLGEFLWFFFFDAIHHRGQLSTYIRPMGGKVPAIYGPSADQGPQS